MGFVVRGWGSDFGGAVARSSDLGGDEGGEVECVGGWREGGGFDGRGGDA